MFWEQRFRAVSQGTFLFLLYFPDPRLARAGVRSHGGKPVRADGVLHDDHPPRRQADDDNDRETLIMA